MKKKMLIGIIVYVGIISVILSACAKKADRNETSIGPEVVTESKAFDDSASYGSTNVQMEEDVLVGNAGGELTNTSGITPSETVINSQDKIIRRMILEVETQEFDHLINTIDTNINQLGGYVESSNISGRRYYKDNMLYGEIIARVPKNRLNEFIKTVNDTANVVNTQENTENVTVKYVDIESHKKSLEIEQERLLALLEKVETLEDIITLETRLSSVRYELESYETQLRTYDNLVEYSTVTLYIQEVERMSVVSDEEKTIWNRIQIGFSDSMYNISDGIKNFVVWFIVNLPYLIIWGIIITVVAFISRRYYRRSKLKDSIQQQTSSPVPNNMKDKK